MNEFIALSSSALGFAHEKFEVFNNIKAKLFHKKFVVSHL